MSSHYCVEKLWLAARDEETLPEINAQAESTYLLVWQHEALETCFKRLNSVEALFFDKIQQGANFAEICNTLAQHRPSEDVAQLALNILLTFVEAGLLSFDV